MAIETNPNTISMAYNRTNDDLLMRIDIQVSGFWPEIQEGSKMSCVGNMLHKQTGEAAAIL